MFVYCFPSLNYEIKPKIFIFFLYKCVGFMRVCRFVNLTLEARKKRIKRFKIKKGLFCIVTFDLKEKKKFKKKLRLHTHKKREEKRANK